MPDVTSRHSYVVSYDVADPKRLRRVFKTLRGWGDHLQLSVFCCDLTDRERAELRGKLSDIINHKEDQVLFVDIGPAGVKARAAFDALGCAYTHAERCVVVV